MSTLSNHAKYEILNNYFSSDEFKIILMESGFVFDRDVHANYDDGLGANDIIDKELSTGNGYTAGGQTLTGISIVENDADDRCDISWDTAIWTASGGSIGPASGAVVYNNTPVGDSNKTVIQWLPFDEDVTATDGNTLPVANIAFRGI